MEEREIIKKDIIDTTKKEFQALTDAIEDGIKGSIIIGSKISQKTFDVKTKKSQIIAFLYSDIVETIEASYNLCLQGHYECVAKLLRNLFEASFTIQKLNSYEEESFEKSKTSVTESEVCGYNNLSDTDKEIFEISLWLDSNIENSSKKKFKFMEIFKPTQMIKEFSEPESLEENLGAYHKLSQFTHPSFQGIISRLQVKEGHVKIDASYKKEFAEGLLKDIFKSIIISSSFLKNYSDLEFSKEELDLINSVGKRYDDLV